MDTTDTGAAKRIGVLARWTDKKYYAGRLKEAKPNSRFVVVFEDGATKTLVKDVIVFGSDDGVLPLLDQYVHARVDGDTYEPGLVTHINTDAAVSADGGVEPVLYTVVAESRTVHVSASDLYLEEEQAKAIQKATEANVPTAASAVAGAAGLAGDSDGSLLKSPGTPSKRAARPTAKFGEAAAPAAIASAANSRARTTTNKAKATATSPSTAPVDAAEPSTSAAAAAAAAAASTTAGGRQTGRRNKRYS